MNKLKNINKVSCIYEIKNKITSSIYIGSTNNLMYRRNYHLNLLTKGLHPNGHLQRAWNKYGKDNFEINIIIYCEPKLLFLYEQRFIDILKPHYNISKNANVPTKRGDKLSLAHIEKIRIANTGKVRSEESKRKQAESRKGIVYSEETHKLWSKQRMGHERTARIHKGLVSPGGVIYKNILNMAKFCREHNLRKNKIYNVEQEKSKHHLGWTLYKDK